MPTLLSSPKPWSQPSSLAWPEELVANWATPSRPPRPSTAAATFRSKWVSTPPVTLRAGSTIVMAIPSLSIAKGWHALHQVCGAGAIALLAQGGPPHPKHGLCHWGPWCRPADRYEDRLTVSRLWSQAGTRAETDRSPVRSAGGGFSLESLPLTLPADSGASQKSSMASQGRSRCPVLQPPIDTRTSSRAA